jgi:hypothetical protein
MSKTKENSEQGNEDLVTVEYIKDGEQAKKGEKIKVTNERAEALRAAGYIK